MDSVEYAIKFNKIIDHCGRSAWIIEILPKQNDESINALYDKVLTGHLIMPMDFYDKGDLKSIFDVFNIGQYKI